MTVDEIRKHAHDWLQANQLQDGSRVRWMSLPIGMVATWIDRAKRAEGRTVSLEAALTVIAEGKSGNPRVYAQRAFEEA